MHTLTLSYIPTPHSGGGLIKDFGEAKPVGGGCDADLGAVTTLKHRGNVFTLKFSLADVDQGPDKISHHSI